MITARVDTSRLDAQLRSLRAALTGAGREGDAATIMKDESRKLVNQIQRFTPPKSQAQGRKAVKRDIQRAMTPLDVSEFKSESLRERLQKLAKDGDIEALNAILKNLKGRIANWRVAAFDPNLHRRARGSRGRVHTSKKLFVVQLRELSRYIASVQSKVGWRKSGWLPALLALGGKAPNWITRHSNNAPGRAFVRLIGTEPTINIASHAPGVSRDESMIANAVRARAEAIRRRVKLLLSNYKQDFKSGNRIKRGATVTADD